MWVGRGDTECTGDAKRKGNGENRVVRRNRRGMKVARMDVEKDDACALRKDGRVGTKWERKRDLQSAEENERKTRSTSGTLKGERERNKQVRSTCIRCVIEWNEQ